MATNNILDLPRDQFMASLNELAAQGVNTDELMRQYRRANSPFSGLFDWAINSERDIANEGRTTAGAGLFSKEAGTTGMDALASTRIEPANFIAGLLSGGAQAVDAAGATLKGLVPAADMPMEALGTAGMAMTGGAAVPKPRGALGANSLRGGGMSDPTQTGWTFRDVKVPQFSPEQNRRIEDMFGRLQWREAELPIRSMYATQDRVNPDFSTTTSSQELVPTVVKYNNEYFVRDGHHRLTRAAEEGRQTANVAIIDLDNTDTSAPLLDYKALSLDEINAQKNEMNSILDQLFGDMSDADIEALANSRTTSANRDATTGAIALPAARNEAERMARQILEMRAAGRAGDVTDAMMAQADPQYMFNNTPMPMDEASRMARAGDMGFDTPAYRGTLSDEVTARPKQFVSENPNVTQSFAGHISFADEVGLPPELAQAEGGNIMPLLVDPRGNTSAVSGYEMLLPGAAIRSRFARFDPEFSHLANLNAANASPLAGILAMPNEEERNRQLGMLFGGYR